MDAEFAELLWADLGNGLRLEACANIADLRCRQCRPLPYWLRGLLRESPASHRLFAAEMKARGWMRYEIERRELIAMDAIARELAI